jgi:hypothetical protein
MSNTPETGWYYLKNPSEYAIKDTSKVYYHSNIEKNQIADLDSNFLTIAEWLIPPRLPEHHFSISYISSITGEIHFHYLDFIVRTRRNPNTIHLLEIKPSNLIEASYNVEKVIRQLSEGKRANSSLTKQELNAISVRDKRIAAEQFVKGHNSNNSNIAQKYAYHLCYNWRPNTKSPITSTCPKTFHDLYLAIKDKLVACDFQSQQDILHYVNSRPEFKDMSRQTLAYHLKKAIDDRYFTKPDYGFYISQGKIVADAKAIAEAEEAEANRAWIALAPQREAAKKAAEAQRVAEAVAEAEAKAAAKAANQAQAQADLEEKKRRILEKNPHFFEELEGKREKYRAEQEAKAAARKAELDAKYPPLTEEQYETQREERRKQEMNNLLALLEESQNKGGSVSNSFQKFGDAIVEMADGKVYSTPDEEVD